MKFQRWVQVLIAINALLGIFSSYAGIMAMRAMSFGLKNSESRESFAGGMLIGGMWSLLLLIGLLFLGLAGGAFVIHWRLSRSQRPGLMAKTFLAAATVFPALVVSVASTGWLMNRR